MLLLVYREFYARKFFESTIVFVFPIPFTHTIKAFTGIVDEWLIIDRKDFTIHFYFDFNNTQTPIALHKKLHKH